MFLKIVLIFLNLTEPSMPHRTSTFLIWAILTERALILTFHLCLTYIEQAFILICAYHMEQGVFIICAYI